MKMLPILEIAGAALIIMFFILGHHYIPLFVKIYRKIKGRII